MTDTLAVVSPYGHGAPSTRVRVYEWLDHLGLEAQRHEYAGLRINSPGVLARQPALAVQAERRTRRLPDQLRGRRVLLSREASPFGWGSTEAEILRASGRGAYDLDDALFADRAGWRVALGKEAKCRAAMQAADVVVVGNDFLAEYAADHAADLRVIPTCVEPTRYTQPVEYAVQDRPRIVWLGSSSTESYLVGIAPALREVVRRTDAEVLVISSARAEELPALEGLITRVPWQPDTFAAHLASAHVGIGPLTDDVYARGKCAYKILQYGAAGLPVVASPVAANGLAIDRFGAWPATSLGDWVDQLLAVLELNTEARAAAGARARRAVETHYSFSAWSERWSEAMLG